MASLMGHFGILGSCVGVCMYIYIYIYVCVYIHTYIHTHVFMLWVTSWSCYLEEQVRSQLVSVLLLVDYTDQLVLYETSLDVGSLSLLMSCFLKCPKSKDE
jgi:hypothetical protein